MTWLRRRYRLFAVAWLLLIAAGLEIALTGPWRTCAGDPVPASLWLWVTLVVVAFISSVIGLVFGVDSERTWQRRLLVVVMWLITNAGIVVLYWLAMRHSYECAGG